MSTNWLVCIVAIKNL